MRAEHLLEAIGLLDDGLIQEAEQYRRPKGRLHPGVWLGWAASFAVVLVLGYGLTHLGMGGGGAAPENRPAASAPAASAPNGGADGTGDAPAEPSSPGAAGDASLDMEGRALAVCVRMDGPMNQLSYTFLHWYGEDRTLDELPEGCVSLGKLELLDAVELPNVPYTDSREYVGCGAWLLREGPAQESFKLYVQRPEGGYLECR